MVTDKVASLDRVIYLAWGIYPSLACTTVADTKLGVSGALELPGPMACLRVLRRLHLPAECPPKPANHGRLGCWGPLHVSAGAWASIPGMQVSEGDVGCSLISAGAKIASHLLLSFLVPRRISRPSKYSSNIPPRLNGILWALFKGCKIVLSS